MHNIPEEAVKAALETWPENGTPYDASKQMRAALTAALPFLPVQGGVSNTKIEAARKAVEELANTQMNLPLEDWSRISSAILSALEPSTARELALEEAARVCDSKIVSMQAHYDQTDNPFIRSNLAGDIALISHLAAAIRALSSPDHADAGKVEEDGWMPISSAPTNKAIQIFVPNADYYSNEGVYAGMLVDRGAGQRWTTFGWAVGRDLSPDTQPVRWRPLPSAPSEGAE